MRRISDGVKVSERWRTTEQVERAFVDDRNFTFLYSDGEGFHFMNPENYDQVVCTPDVVGDAAAWLQDGMTVMLSTHDGVPIALELPRLLTLEITDTEPAVKNQTASSSYKPATLSNGAHHGAALYRRQPGRDPRGLLLPRARQGLGCPEPPADHAGRLAVRIESWAPDVGFIKNCVPMPAAPLTDAPENRQRA
jgi:hypothetical protein